MYRDGVYNRNYGPDERAKPKPKRSGQSPWDRDSGYNDGSNLVKGDAGVSGHHSRREVIPELGQDPHGYGLAQDNVRVLTARRHLRTSKQISCGTIGFM